MDTLSGSKEKIHHAFDKGITYIDLANNYGPSYGSAEETFGQIMKKSSCSLSLMNFLFLRRLDMICGRGLMGYGIHGSILWLVLTRV